MPIKGAVKPEHFSTGFDEEWKVVEKNVMEQKDMS